MCNSEFAHLHVHTDASLRDGMGTVSNLMGTAKRLGFQQLAMTDHGTLANAVTFNIEASRAGIKPIMGLEGYIAFDGSIGHITLLADGKRGWNNLLKINNLSHRSEFKQPAFTIDELIKHKAGIICLSGCIASPIHQLSWKDSMKLASRLKSAFQGRFFAELMFVGTSTSWERPLKLAQTLNIQPVITNDVHFAEKHNGEVHDVLTLMKSGFEYDSQDLYLREFKEMLEAGMKHGLDKEEVETMLKQAGTIAQKIKTVDLSAEPVLPHVGINVSDFELNLYSMPRGKLLKSKEYEDRMKYELEVITNMGYLDYFVILDDLISFARKNNVKVGPGRGSGAGSLILYLMAITDVDPIKHGLQFERFLNPERKGMPDVDVDLDSANRGIVLEYANKKYGSVPISTYSKYSHRSLVRDLGKFFKLDKKRVDKMAEAGDSSDEFNQLMTTNGRFRQSYESFIGQMRHKGKHAGGVIITDTPVPVERIGSVKDKQYAAAWTEGKDNELSYAGIVKFDLLGLSALAALRELEEKTGDRPPEEPIDGDECYELFRSGILAGVFQFSGSDGIRRLTMELEPNKLADLTAINALYRPGAIDAGALEFYPQWRKTPRKIHPSIDDVLEETYGAIVYQEQLMEIFRRFVGGTYGQADLARRLIVKAKPDDPEWVKKIDQLKENFLNGGLVLGLTLKEGRSIWDELITHARYSFNKAHSTAYAMIAYQCAWWKWNYPAEFYAAMLNSDPAQEQTYILEAVEHGVKIGPPSVNKSLANWNGESMRLNFPLAAIKFMGQKGADAIVEERNKNGEFTSIENLMDRVPKKVLRGRGREGLWRLGGMKDILDPADSFEDITKKLSLKDIDSGLNVRERQLKYLGVIVPTKRMLLDFKKWSGQGWTCGIINSRDVRTSNHKNGRPYVVYKLSPNGVFWSSTETELQKGQVVRALIGDKGRLKKVGLL